MNQSTLLAAVAVTVMLSGCAAMNEQECLVSNWRTVGFEDGAAGRPPETIGRYRQACAEHGVSPDLDMYRAGHADGIESFCQPVKGFNLGHAGGTYHGVCPAEVEYEFVAAYNEGRQLHDLEYAVRSTDSQISRRKRALENLRADLVDAEAALVSDLTTPEERVALLAETKELARQQGVIEAEIVELERERALQAQELLNYRNTLAYDF